MVRTITDEFKQAGVYNVKIDLASGVYLYKIIAGDFFEVKKMVVLK